ncbi:hypothetical protein KSF96_024150, partial [Escherichia coli]|nr:hypothetical protein [Escherichia coli]
GVTVAVARPTRSQCTAITAAVGGFNVTTNAMLYDDPMLLTTSEDTLPKIAAALDLHYKMNISFSVEAYSLL